LLYTPYEQRGCIVFIKENPLFQNRPYFAIIFGTFTSMEPTKPQFAPPDIPAKFLKPYDPKSTENATYEKWLASGFFNPETCIEKGVTKPDAEAFSMVLPPPNVTGTLHMGHAYMLTIEDIMVRYKRMNGFRTLWLPGTDHAAIATQAKVESIIYKEENKRRQDLGREELIRRIEEFAKASHSTITNQVKRMGASIDWSLEAYTLDKPR
jgi:valyl-tRNA synthetase